MNALDAKLVNSWSALVAVLTILALLWVLVGYLGAARGCHDRGGVVAVTFPRPFSCVRVIL